jgi:hypothetical protein
LFYGRKQFFVWFFQGPADQLENKNLEAAMPTTIIPFTPATTLFEPAEKRKTALTTRRTKRSRVSSLNEPETRLWKVCAQASLREAIIELLVLAVLILITMALLVDCFVEVQQQL